MKTRPTRLIRRAAVGALLGAATAVFTATSPLTASAAPVASLNVGQSLAVGKSLSSPHGMNRLVVQADGNLVLYTPAGAAWSSRSVGSGKANHLDVQADGNVVLRTSAGKTVWSPYTQGTGSKNALLVQDDGNLVVRTAAGKAVWNASTRSTSLAAGHELAAGQYLTSPDDGSRLVMQGDCNLVSYSAAGKARWSSQTNGKGSGCRLVMQSDGNLVVYHGSVAVWNTRTRGSGATQAVLDNSGTLSVSSPTHTAWTSNGTTPPASGWTSSVGGTISRSEVMARADYWYQRRSAFVYDQGGSFADPTGRQYRTDCSGFTSMALHADQNYSSYDFANDRSLTTSIAKEQLQPGDVMSAVADRNHDFGHVAIFEKWTSSAHTSYWAYEFGETPVAHHIIPYPYFSNDSRVYQPYRYTKITG